MPTRHDYRNDFRRFHCVTLHRGHAPRKTWDATRPLCVLALAIVVMIVW